MHVVDAGLGGYNFSQERYETEDIEADFHDLYHFPDASGVTGYTAGPFTNASCDFTLFLTVQLASKNRLESVEVACTSCNCLVHQTLSSIRLLQGATPEGACTQRLDRYIERQQKSPARAGLDDRGTSLSAPLRHRLGKSWKRALRM
jgi:hypothetical protein